MKRYSQVLKPVEIKEKVENGDLAELIAVLRDGRFSNEEMRKKMIDILTSIYAMGGREVGQFFKKLGDKMTDLGDEMLDDIDSDEEIEMENDDIEVEIEPEEDGLEIEIESNDNKIPFVIN